MAIVIVLGTSIELIEWLFWERWRWGVQARIAAEHSRERDNGGNGRGAQTQRGLERRTAEGDGEQHR